MKKETVKDEEIKAPKDAERFTAKVKNADAYLLRQVYNFGGQDYRLDAIMKDGDSVSLEFVRTQRIT